MSLASLQISRSGKRKASDELSSSVLHDKKPKIVTKSNLKRGREATIAYWPGSTEEIDLTVPKFGEWRLSNYSHARATELNAYRSEPAKDTFIAEQHVRKCREVLAKEYQQPTFGLPSIRKPESIDWKERLAKISATGFSKSATSSSRSAVSKKLPRYGAWVTDDLDTISSSLKTLQSDYTESPSATAKPEIANRNATRSPLLKIPAEIRLKIWKAYFKDPMRYQKFGPFNTTAYRHTHFHSFTAPDPEIPCKSVVIIRRRLLPSRLDTIQFYHLSDRSPIRPISGNGLPSSYAPFLGVGLDFLSMIGHHSWADEPITQQATNPGSWIPRTPLLLVCSQTFNEAHILAQDALHTYSFSNPRTMEAWLRDGCHDGVKPERYRRIVRQLYVTFEVRDEVADLLCGLVEVIVPKAPFWLVYETGASFRKDFDPFGFFAKVCSFWGKKAKVTVVDK